MKVTRTSIDLSLDTNCFIFYVYIYFLCLFIDSKSNLKLKQFNDSKFSMLWLKLSGSCPKVLFSPEKRPLDPFLWTNVWNVSRFSPPQTSFFLRSLDAFTFWRISSPADSAPFPPHMIRSCIFVSITSWSSSEKQLLHQVSQLCKNLFFWFYIWHQFFMSELALNDFNQPVFELRPVLRLYSNSINESKRF